MDIAKGNSRSKEVTPNSRSKEITPRRSDMCSSFSPSKMETNGQMIMANYSALVNQLTQDKVKLSNKIY